METDQKKITAAIAAVCAYMQEEAAAQAAIPQTEPTALFGEPTGFVRPWALSGRQAMMQVRNLMQLRTFTRW